MSPSFLMILNSIECISSLAVCRGRGAGQVSLYHVQDVLGHSGDSYPARTPSNQAALDHLGHTA